MWEIATGGTGDPTVVCIIRDALIAACVTLVFCQIYRKAGSGGTFGEHRMGGGRH